MRGIKLWLLTAIAGIILFQSVCIARSRPRVDRIVGVTRGICVLLGDTNCELALELARNPAFAGLIYVQLPRAEDVETGPGR